MKGLTITRRMDGKLEGLWAINTSSLDNPFCLRMAKKPKNICSECFSQRMLRGLRKGCRPSMTRNLEVLSKPMKKYPRIRKPHTFRFSAHGELMNRQHVINYYEIARLNPHVTFAMWTKRPNLVRGLKKPSNLFLVYSSPEIGVRAKKPAGFDKVFTVYPKGYKGRAKINCHGKRCAACLLCYQKGTTFINELLRKR